MRSRPMKPSGVRLYHARFVLAGAYRGALTRAHLDRPMFSHYLDVTEGHWSSEKTLCRRVLAERLSDLSDEKAATCTVCAERFARAAAKGLALFTQRSPSTATSRSTPSPTSACTCGGQIFHTLDCPCHVPPLSQGIR